MKEKMYVVNIHINGVETASQPMLWVNALHVAQGGSMALSLLGQKRPCGVNGLVAHMDGYWDLYENASVIIESESDS